MSQGKLIVASTRLPLTMARRQDGWHAAESTGGLVTALKSVAERREFVWFGWPGTNVAEGERGVVSTILERSGNYPVFLSKGDIEGFYEGFSNRVVWPLFHGLVDRSHFTIASWKSYKKVNRTFAEHIAAHVGSDDLVWIHDYQLCLVPEMLRQMGVQCPVGFFLHIPFPSSELYRTLPVRETLLRGLLGADLIGFHAYEYVSHFRKACLRVLGIDSEPEALNMPSRNVRLAVLPIGIDPADIHDMGEAPEAIEEYDKLTTAYEGKKLIIGVDRLDYTKGIPEKLRAYEELLRHYPKWRTKAVLVQVAAPSRENVDEYRALKRQVDETVGHINGRYGSPTHTPIVYINQAISRTRLVGMYQAADLALVTPIRDGMNLVALEYVAARAARGGRLILSEFAGAAHLLSGARLVSPYNTVQVAEALAEALEEDPLAEGFGHMLDFVNHNTAMFWANRFLDRLEDTIAEIRPRAVRLEVNHAPAVSTLKGARRPLVLLDYDGTLRPYERKPMAATPTSRIRGVLADLAGVATVYVVSGRPGEVLDAWLGDLPLGLVCEHGFAIKEPEGRWVERGGGSPSGLRVIEPLFEDFVRRTPGSMIERKRSSIAWHYRAADPEYGTFQANELLTLLEDTLKRRPLKVLRGNRVVEVRHESVTKGHAVSELLRRHPATDVLFCAGDDRTDEDMMNAVARSGKARAVTCWVGGRNSTADFWVESSDALLDELNALVDLWTAPRPKRASYPPPRSKPRHPKPSGRRA